MHICAMLSKEEAKNIRVQFWDNFAQRMRKHKSEGGYRVNWLKYNTRTKGIVIRAFADENNCTVSLDFEHKNSDVRELQLEQMDELRVMFAGNFNTKYTEDPNFVRENGTVVHRFYFVLEGHSIFRTADHPTMYTFMQTHLKAMDAFWNNFGELFEVLQ